MVVAAAERSEPESDQALASLCELYWPALYGYVRRRVVDAHEAQELTLAFFAELLEKNYIGDADRQRGRFRSFLITAFKHFLSKEWDKAKAQNRGGGHRTLSFDFQKADSSIRIEPTSSTLTAEQLYDREWAMTLLSRTMERLQKQANERQQVIQFETIKRFLIGERQPGGYRAAAECLGMTEVAIRQAVSRLRKEYQKLLHEEIAETVSSSDEVEDEIHKLFQSLEL
jgi:RNA polymerase sigma-70 factor (ECF subfamily)